MTAGESFWDWLLKWSSRMYVHVDTVGLYGGDESLEPLSDPTSLSPPPLGEGSGETMIEATTHECSKVQT